MTTFEIGKKYITRQGRLAVIDEISSENKTWCLVGRCKGKSAIWNKTGRYDRDGYDHENDLMEEVVEK